MCQHLFEILLFICIFHKNMKLITSNKSYVSSQYLHILKVHQNIRYILMHNFSFSSDIYFIINFVLTPFLANINPGEKKVSLGCL